MSCDPAKDAYEAGFADAYQQRDDFTWGRTFSNPALNEAYDRGVNAAQAQMKDTA